MRRLSPLLVLLAGILTASAAHISSRAAAASAVGGKPSQSPSPSPSPSQTPPSSPPAISPSTHAFGTVCVGVTSPPFAFSITNTADDTMNIQSISVALPFVAEAPAAAIVPTGESTTFRVRYRPTGAGGDGGTVIVSTDHGSVTAAVSGRGLDRQLSVAPTSLSFGPQRTGKTSGARAVTIANTGTETLDVSGVALAGSDAAEFSLSGGGAFGLAGGASRQVSVSFTPSSDGAKSAELQVASNACVSPVRVVELSGAGARPKIAVRPSRIEIGALPGTQGKPATVTVSSIGDVSLTVTGVRISGDSSRQIVVNGLPQFPATLVAGDSFSFDVRFVPRSTQGAPPTAMLEISSNDPKSAVTKIQITTTFVSPSPTPSASPSPSPSAAAPPVEKSIGPRIRLGALAGYVSVFVVFGVVAALFGALVLLRNLKTRRIIKRFTG